MTTHHTQQAVQAIQALAPNFKPKLGIILGSGLASIADHIQNPVIIPYTKIPGFFGQDSRPLEQSSSTSISGHPGKLYLGNLEGYPVVCLQGRVHLYQGIAATHITHMIATLKALGCESLLITNAAGSLREDIPEGSLLCLTDHINMQGRNPLVGLHDKSHGVGFVPMQNAYDDQLRADLLTIAAQLKIKLATGVYIGVLGPSFETPAEIRAFKIMGADAVGMSTIAETIAARYYDLKVLAISVITNMAAGFGVGEISHTQTLSSAAASLENLTRLILAYVRSLHNV
jgi:xanthosine phosphorylase